MNMIRLFFLFCAGCLFSVENYFVFVIPSYNNIRYCKKNLNSVFSQKYANYRVIYIDDCSTDGTADAVESIVNQMNQSNRFTLIRNAVRKGALENIYDAVHSCFDHEIIVSLDGDDWLFSPFVLNKLNHVYSTSEVWITHGAFIEFPHGKRIWSIPVPASIVEANAFRKFRCPSHLRTFYAWLFKAIDVDDLKYEREFFKMTWDQAFMFPMLEMAAERHAFISDLTYVYNLETQISDNKKDPELQQDLEAYIRNLPPYTRLENHKMKELKAVIVR